jgi:hypothetical protein
MTIFETFLLRKINNLPIEGSNWRSHRRNFEKTLSGWLTYKTGGSVIAAQTGVQSLQPLPWPLFFQQ